MPWISLLLANLRRRHHEWRRRKRDFTNPDVLLSAARDLRHE